MKIWVFSIGEPTTELCCKLLEEYGLEVILLQDSTSLWDKLKRFYTEALATGDDRVMRIDADIIPNANIKHLYDVGWVCASGFDWYKQSEGAISIHSMERRELKLCSLAIDGARNKNRPESHLWRLPSINPLTYIDDDHIYGIHGYGQASQRDRIKLLKQSRGQEYDWDLVERIEAL